MEVILLEDVKTLGKKGQIVKINDGYARNYVLPKKLGLEATPKNLNDLKLEKARQAKLEIEAVQVKLSIKTGEGGKTFGAVSSKEIAVAMKEQNGLDIDKKKLKLDESIKALGTYEVPVKVHKDVTAKLKVVVEGSN